MAKKCIVVGIVVLAVMILIFPVYASSEKIDQQQSHIGEWSGSINIKDWDAQGFVPTLDILTKVKLNIFVSIYDTPAGDFVVSIRSGLPSSDDLTSISMSASDLPHGYHGEWVEFDFPDISVMPDTQYYIVSRHTQECQIAIGLQRETNPYPHGEMGVSSDFGRSWYYHSADDIAFETYGYDEAEYEWLILAIIIIGGLLAMFVSIYIKIWRKKKK